MVSCYSDENSCGSETVVSSLRAMVYRPYESELSTVAFSIALHGLFKPVPQLENCCRIKLLHSDPLHFPRYRGTEMHKMIIQSETLGIHAANQSLTRRAKAGERGIPALEPPLIKGLKTLGKEGRVVVKGNGVLGETPKVFLTSHGNRGRHRHPRSRLSSWWRSRRCRTSTP